MAPKQIGPYRLIKLLGSGRTAEVHCAMHKTTKELVAIKLLHEYLTDQQMKQKFQAEAEVVQMLSHPGIVRIVDAGFYQQTRPYIMMTYAPGNSLRQRHPRGSVLPLQTILAYTKQISSALAYAHKKNIIHCDIKPENILVDKNDSLLLSDFGIARIQEKTLSQTTRDPFGTATYMAPEQFRGKYSPATDQYALAIMIYEWFCGTPPFSGENYNQLMDRHMTMPAPSLQDACKERNKNRNIPLAVEHVLLKALAKDPDARFSSIEEFAQALEEAFPPDAILNKANSYVENPAFATQDLFGSSQISSHRSQLNKAPFQIRQLRQQHSSRRMVLLGVVVVIGVICFFTLQSSQWFTPLFSPLSLTHPEVPSPKASSVSSNPTQVSPSRIELQYHEFYLTIDAMGLLNNSPQAINAVKQQVRQQPFLQNRTAGNTIVYGGALSTGEISRATEIANKVYQILKSLGQEGFAFQRSSYYQSLFVLGEDPSRVRVDVYLFAK